MYFVPDSQKRENSRDDDDAAVAAADNVSVVVCRTVRVCYTAPPSTTMSAQSCSLLTVCNSSTSTFKTRSELVTGQWLCLSFCYCSN